MRILTNIAHFPDQWEASGRRGTCRRAKGYEQFVAELPEADLVLVDGDPALALRLAAYRLNPFHRVPPIVAVDLVLRHPGSSNSGWAGNLLKRFLYSRIDHYIHYFKDLRQYQQLFGIGPDRSSFVPFKPNIRYRHEVTPNSNGDYVLCFGRSLRDYDTFFDAMQLLPLPGAIPTPDFAGLKKHGSRFTRKLEDVPGNVKLLEDDGSSDALIKVIGNARVVVLPILASSLLAGIGTYLNAMFMGKCVIVSEGPGCSDVLTDGQCLLVPPENPRALADMIDRAWNDDALREQTAARGYQYASSLGGEPELYQRILEKVVAFDEARLK